jgi:hypothetical protein
MRVTNMVGYCGNSRDTRQAASLGLLIYVDVVQHDALVSKHPYLSFGGCGRALKGNITW